MRATRSTDLCFSAIVKGHERYIWLYEDTTASRQAVLERIDAQANDPDLSLEPADADLLRWQIVGEPPAPETSIPVWLDWLLVLGGVAVLASVAYCWGRGMGLIADLVWGLVQ